MSSKGKCRSLGFAVSQTPSSWPPAASPQTNLKPKALGTRCVNVGSLVLDQNNRQYQKRRCSVTTSLRPFTNERTLERSAFACMGCQLAWKRKGNQNIALSSWCSIRWLSAQRDICLLAILFLYCEARMCTRGRKTNAKTFSLHPSKKSSTGLFLFLKRSLAGTCRSMLLPNQTEDYVRFDFALLDGHDGKTSAKSVVCCNWSHRRVS